MQNETNETKTEQKQLKKSPHHTMKENPKKQSVHDPKKINNAPIKPKQKENVSDDEYTREETLDWEDMTQLLKLWISLIPSPSCQRYSANAQASLSTNPSFPCYVWLLYQWMTWRTLHVFHQCR